MPGDASPRVRGQIQISKRTEGALQLHGLPSEVSSRQAARLQKKTRPDEHDAQEMGNNICMHIEHSRI